MIEITAARLIKLISPTNQSWISSNRGPNRLKPLILGQIWRFTLDESCSFSAVNSTFYKYSVRDKSTHERGGHEETSFNQSPVVVLSSRTKAPWYNFSKETELH